MARATDFSACPRRGSTRCPNIIAFRRCTKPISLRNPYHDARTLALLILVLRYQKGDAAERDRVFALYLERLDFINNWDLVDCSAPYVVGPHLRFGDRPLLLELAASPDIWHRRVAILATLHFIRAGELAPTLEL